MPSQGPGLGSQVHPQPRRREEEDKPERLTFKNENFPFLSQPSMSVVRSAVYFGGLSGPCESTEPTARISQCGVHRASACLATSVPSTFIVY